MRKNKTVLVTGASGGIGRSIALRFAEEGYRVAICARQREKELSETRDLILALGADCLANIADVSDERDVARLFSEIEERFHGPDVLINNAGISYIGLLQDMDLASWEEIIRTDLTSVFLCSRAAIRKMLSCGGGSIVNISSVWGISGASCETAYSAAKGGVNVLTRALARELAPSNIRVNAIAAGAIQTRMNSFLQEEEHQKLLDEIPMGRMGSTEEVAELVYSVAHQGYLTGQVIALDGGWI